MAYQTWLADVLRAAGLKVVEVPGWKTRGYEAYNPVGVIIHETQGSAGSTDAGEINVMINGREGLAGPIAQVYLSKTGTWHVVTAGRSNHVKVGWAGPFSGKGNSSLLGIEAQHAGGEGWTPLQYDSYVRGVAAICKARGWHPPVGHKEHQPGDKTDPGFNMTMFRVDVRAAMSGGEDDMKLYRVNGQAEVWAYDGSGRRHVPDEATLARVKTATGATTTVLLASQADLDLIAPLPSTAVPADLTARLDVILAAALDDGDVSVVLDPAALAEVQAIRADMAGLPAATADLVHADLAD